MHRSRPAHLGLVLLLAGACEPAAPSDTAIRTDSAGVRIVEYPELPPMEASRIAIAAEPDLVLGASGAFSGPDYEFFRISGVLQLQDGTLVVANAGTSELRFYGADGSFLRAVGRDGDGPGEFRNLWDLWIVAGDTVVTWDPSARRLQYFSPDGAFVRSASIPPAPFTEFLSGRPGGSQVGLPSMPQAVLRNGRVVVFIEPLSPGIRSAAPERSAVLVALHRIDEGGWDSVRVVPGQEKILRAAGGTFSYVFGAYSMAAAAGATMAVADLARFRVELFDPDGRLVSILSAPVPEVPVTSDVIEAQIEHMVQTVEGVTDGDGYSDRLRGAYTARHAPSLPTIRAVFVDEDERIWVERQDIPGSRPSRWEVFENDGTWVGRVEMPRGFARGMSNAMSGPGFSIRSGRLAGVWRDPATGVETVRVYRLMEEDS